MKRIEMGEEYAKRYEGLIVDRRRTLARVWPIPQSVVVETHFPDDELTPEQAEALARMLIRAAEDARHLHVPDGEHDGRYLYDDRLLDTAPLSPVSSTEEADRG